MAKSTENQPVVVLPSCRLVVLSSCRVSQGRVVLDNGQVYLPNSVPCLFPESPLFASSPLLIKLPDIRCSIGHSNWFNERHEGIDSIAGVMFSCIRRVHAFFLSIFLKKKIENAEIFLKGNCQLKMRINYKSYF